MMGVKLLEIGLIKKLRDERINVLSFDGRYLIVEYAVLSSGRISWHKLCFDNEEFSAEEFSAEEFLTKVVEIIIKARDV